MQKKYIKETTVKRHQTSSFRRGNPIVRWSENLAQRTETEGPLQGV